MTSVIDLTERRLPKLARLRLRNATIRRPLFLCVAVCCRIGVGKPVSLLEVTHRFCMLRAQWCQKWCQMVSYDSVNQ